MPESDLITLSDVATHLSFGMWADPDVNDIDFNGETVQGGLSSFTVADLDLAKLVAIVLQATVNGPVTRKLIQKLLVPKNWGSVMKSYRNLLASFADVQQDFFCALAGINVAVYDAFGLTAVEKAHVEKRLAEFPPSELKPRYPWSVVEARPLALSTEDRFR